MNLIRLSLALILSPTLAACEPKTMDECLAAAAKDAKSNAALEILTGVCEREHKAERFLVKNIGKHDDVLLTPPLSFLLEGVHSLKISRSTMEQTEVGIKAAIRDLEPPAEQPEIRPLFDPDGKYSSTSTSQLEIVGIKEFDCKNKRTRWLNSDTKLYVGSRGEPEAVLVVGNEYRLKMEDLHRQWSYNDNEAPDFQYVCNGKIDQQAVRTFRYSNLCGKNYDGACTLK